MGLSTQQRKSLGFSNNQAVLVVTLITTYAKCLVKTLIYQNMCRYITTRFDNTALIYEIPPGAFPLLKALFRTLGLHRINIIYAILGYNLLRYNVMNILFALPGVKCVREIVNGTLFSFR